MSKVGQRLIEGSMQALYFSICVNQYPDTFNAVKGLIEDGIYSKHQLNAACAECAYIIDHDELPTWATVIESFEVIDGNYMFVYGDVVNLH